MSRVCTLGNVPYIIYLMPIIILIVAIIVFVHLVLSQAVDQVSEYCNLSAIIHILFFYIGIDLTLTLGNCITHLS